MNIGIISGGIANAEAPQAFKEGASTLRNAHNRTHISYSAAAWVWASQITPQ